MPTRFAGVSHKTNPSNGARGEHVTESHRFSE